MAVKEAYTQIPSDEPSGTGDSKEASTSCGRDLNTHLEGSRRESPSANRWYLSARWTCVLLVFTVCTVYLSPRYIRDLSVAENSLLFLSHASDDVLQFALWCASLFYTGTKTVHSRSLTEATKEWWQEDADVLGGGFNQVQGLQMPFYRTEDLRWVDSIRRSNGRQYALSMFWERQDISASVTFSLNPPKPFLDADVDRFRPTDSEKEPSPDCIDVDGNVADSRGCAGKRSTATDPSFMEFSWMYGQSPPYSSPEVAMTPVNITLYFPSSDVLFLADKKREDGVEYRRSISRQWYKDILVFANERKEAGKEVRSFESEYAAETVKTQAKSDNYKETEQGRDNVRCALLVFIHGGGWMGMDHNVYDKLYRRHVNDLNRKFDKKREGFQSFQDGVHRRENNCFLLAAVDYRLAPETPFPGGLEDVIMSLNWLTQNAERLGINKHEIFLEGDSAGGNLAAAAISVALEETAPHRATTKFTKEEKKDDKFDWIFGVRAVGLIYPSLCKGCPTLSAIRHDPVFRVNAKSAIWFDLLYSSVPFMHNQQNDWRPSPYLSPAEILQRWPTTFTVLFTHDTLFDIGVLFHGRLKKAGVSSKLYVRPGVHGFYGSDTFSRYGVEASEWMAEKLCLTLD